MHDENKIQVTFYGNLIEKKKSCALYMTTISCLKGLVIISNLLEAFKCLTWTISNSCDFFTVNLSEDFLASQGMSYM